MKHHRRFLTPGASNKRREREGFEALNPYPTKISKPNIPKPDPAPATLKKASEPPASSSNNLLLAGYLAHEFLTKGTLFGQRWDPARAEAVPVSAKLKRLKSSSSQMAKAEPNVKADEPQVEKYQRYVEIANLLKTDGAHIPGIVNPTQLASFLQL